MEAYEYKAFISYRHTRPDMEIAKRLHTLIENYHIPGSVQKLTGIRKMGRVFRDQEELPLAVDLGEDIEEALKHSQWLIVICSPRLLKSDWCMREIDTFIRLGKRDHILAVLIEGEPDDSFPPQLRVIEKNGQTEQIEPLAADIRGRNLAESLWKLRREKLRLLAPMLDLNYDALRQRAKARQQRIRLGVTSAALAAVTAFSTYAVVQNRRIARERDTAQNNEMMLLMEKSNAAVANGNKASAKTYLSQALALRAQVGERNDEQMTQALEYAVYTGLFEPVATLDAANRNLSAMVFSEDDTMLLGITDLNSAALIDVGTGAIRYTVSRAMSGKISAVGFLDHDEYFYLLDDWYGFVSVYRSADGSLAAEYSAGLDTAWAIGEKVFPLGDGQLLIVRSDRLVCWNYLTGDETVLLERSSSLFTQPLTAEGFHDGNRIAVGTTGMGEECFLYDRTTGESLPLEADANRGYMELSLSGDDAYLAAKSGMQIWVFRTDTGGHVLTYESEAGFGSPLRYLLTNDALIAADDAGIHCISVPDGKLLWERSDLTGVTDLALSPDCRYLCFGGGILDGKTGALVSGANGTLFSHDGTLLLLNDYQLAVTDQSATVRRAESFSGELYKTVRDAASAGGSFNLMHNSTAANDPNHQPRILNDPDGKYAVYAHGDGFVEIFSPGQENPVAAYGEHCYNAVTDLALRGDLLLSAGGYGRSAVLFDCASGSIRQVFRCSGFVSGVEFSPDGTKLMLLSRSLSGSGDTARIYAVDSGRLLFSMESGETPAAAFGFTTDGTEAVLLLQDGSAVIGALFDSMEEMIEQTEF